MYHYSQPRMSDRASQQDINRWMWDQDSQSSRSSDLDGSAWAPGMRNRQYPTYYPRPMPSRYSYDTSMSSRSEPPRLDPNSGQLGVQRYVNLLKRLQWKCSLLAFSHRTYCDWPSEDREYACTQFKLDFFDFYSLLERALVHLLKLFRISVVAFDSAEPPRMPDDKNPRGPSLVGGAKGPVYHRYHANVLQALSEPGPLHDLLGQGEVFNNLMLAKTLRNKWKEIDQYPQQVPDPAISKSKPSDNAADRDNKHPDVPSAEVLQHMMQTISDGMVAARQILENAINHGMKAGENWAAIQTQMAQMYGGMAFMDDYEFGVFDSMDDTMDTD